MDQILKIYTKINEATLLQTLPLSGIITLKLFSKEYMEQQKADAGEEPAPLPYAEVLDSSNNKIMDVYPNQFVEVIYNGSIINSTKM